MIPVQAATRCWKRPAKAERTFRNTTIQSTVTTRAKGRPLGSINDVNEQDVDDDRSKQGQREWDVAIDQEQDRRNDLEQKYRDQIMGNKKRADELAGRSGRRRAGMK